MLVVKEPLYAKIQTPTSAYLNSGQLPESANLSLKLTEGILRTPTNPHVNRMWTISINNGTLYFTTPDNLFKNTGLKKYFRNLLDYQVASGIVEPKDFSTYKYRKLFKKLEIFLEGYNEYVSSRQKKMILAILQRLAQTTNISIRDLYIEANADKEIVIVKKSESGTHYIVVGDEENDISYLLISNAPGVYSSLHLDKRTSLDKIIESFSGE